MIHSHETAETVNQNSDFLWGAREIGRVLGVSETAAFHLLEQQRLKSPKKIGARWVVSRRALLVELGAA